MAKRIEIIGKSLVVTDTVSSDVLLDVPKSDYYYNIKRLVDNGLIVFYNLDFKDNLKSSPDPIYLSEAVDSTDTAFDEAGFIAFCRANLGFRFGDGDITVNPLTIYPVENEYADINSVSQLLDDQVNQTENFFQYVIDATDDGRVTSVDGDAYYQKLSTSTGSLADYRLLTDSEVLVLQNNNSWRIFRISAINDDSTPLTTVPNTRVGVDYNVGTDFVTAFLFDRFFSDTIENISTASNMSIQVYNQNTDVIYLATITSFDIVGQYLRANVTSTIDKDSWAVNQRLEFVFDSSGGAAQIAPIPNEYANLAALIAGQGSQLTNWIYEVVDGSGFTGITSGIVWAKYKGTTTGTEADYSWEPRGDIPVSKTGTNVVFTEDAWYNKITPLTSGNITFDMTGAIEGKAVWMWFDGYEPSFSIINPIGTEKYYFDGGTFDTGTINIVSAVWDNNSISVKIDNRSILSAPYVQITAGDEENLVFGYTVINATSYKIYFNEVENTYADLATMFADQGNQTANKTNYVTAENKFYEYLGTTSGDISDYTELSDEEIGSATEIVAYDGTSPTYTHTGLTNNTEYIYFVQAFGGGYLDSKFGYSTGTPVTSTDFLTSLIAAYKLNADASDYLGVHDATTETAITYVAGMVGNAASFNGTTSLIEIPDHNDFSFTDGAGTDTSFTILFSINLPNTSQRYVFGKEDGTTHEWSLRVLSNLLIFYCYDISTGNYIRAYIGAGAVVGSLHRVGITYTGSESHTGFEIYLDGSLTGATKSTLGTYNGMTNGAGTLRIGDIYDSSLTKLAGTVDQIQIYKNRVFNAAEIAADWDLVSVGTDPLP